MQCPHYNFNDGDNTFGEHKKECTECSSFQECLLKYYYESNQDSITGDNYPTPTEIHMREQLKSNRKEMMVKLINEDNPKITIDEIFDMMLDLELYNKKCKKPKRKRKKK